MEERVELHVARGAAEEVRRAADQLAVFAERLSVVIEPAQMAEYDILVAREAAAISERVAAFARLGLGVPSLEEDVD
jgi:hypothetical protein